MFDTIVTDPASISDDGVKACNANTDELKSSCPSDRDCCAAQYSPSGYGCTTVDGAGCCLVGAALGSDELNPDLPNCLVMGDSVSIGYEYPVSQALKDVCNVQHSPWDVSNGGWGQSATALNCLDIMLKTANQEAMKWDVIFFNNGLHDLDINTTEAVEVYKQNMDGITRQLKNATDKLLYGLTTPMMLNYNNGNTMVEDLNVAAIDIMDEYGVPHFDLYQRVADFCGPIPYVDCGICSASPCDYHYTSPGYAWIAVTIEEAILSVL
ncbi:hypothetical protein TrLO_g12459 [Triparma laevis f. longispina]|uniref:SGNH/GDSL hydrolase family protein n=1 Tax=Triparma laevis f. longispina TaxID=1714387 RepID=A0A9W7A579_9STRA|nr:hypothetical protein TrLO_g12459 [Triparma laevis f. longispina]